MVETAEDRFQPARVRAQLARERARALSAQVEALRRQRNESQAMCLSVRDRILDADWRAHGLARNPTLESSLHASHRRFAARVGRSPDIDRAKELIAARLGCSPEEAFAVLRRLSQKRNEKLAAVARGVVAAEERRPAGGAGASPSLR